MVCTNINKLIFFSNVVKSIRPTYGSKEELAALRSMIVILNLWSMHRISGEWTEISKKVWTVFWIIHCILSVVFLLHVYCLGFQTKSSQLFYVYKRNKDKQSRFHLLITARSLFFPHSTFILNGKTQQANCEYCSDLAQKTGRPTTRILVPHSAYCFTQFYDNWRLVALVLHRQ